jgi:hypothetical protein
VNVVTFTQAVRPRFDAGLFRQYMAITYGQDLEIGMTGDKYSKAIRDAKLLILHLGENPNHASITKVFDTAIKDFKMFEVLNEYNNQ